MLLRTTVAIAAVSAVILGAFFVAHAPAAELGQPTRFSKGHPITIGSLTIQYLGERHVSHPVFKPGFTYHDFKVSDGRATQTVSWSAGTGEIGPQEFTVSGTEYVLELRHSIAREGWLREDEVVLWRAADFRKAAAARAGR